MNSLLMISIFLSVACANSESDKWTWPSTANDQKQQADSRQDIYHQNVNSNEKLGRIRVPTSSFDDQRRPLQQQPYQVKDPIANKPKPLSDEFSNESSGENYSNNINGYNGNRPSGNSGGNRFGPQQPNDFPGQFGYGQQYPGGFPGGPVPFPGAYGGQGLYPGQYPIGPGAGGFLGHSLANGILVGPGGPTGIIGRPLFGGGGGYFGGQGNYPGGGYGGGFSGAGFGGGYPGAGFGGGFPGGSGFDGQHNGIGGPQFGGPGISPYNPQFGGGFGPFQRPFYDPTSNNNNNSQDKKVVKSAKSAK